MFLIPPSKIGLPAHRLKPDAALSLEALPVLVKFGDLNDPTSVALADPQDLAASFGLA
jgi:hypothetical protein